MNRRTRFGRTLRQRTEADGIRFFHQVEVADTVGAGDSFSGAFVYSILAGKSLREAHQTAVGTAAFVCTKEGAWPAYPNKD